MRDIDNQLWEWCSELQRRIEELENKNEESEKHIHHIVNQDHTSTPVYPEKE